MEMGCGWWCWLKKAAQRLLPAVRQANSFTPSTSRQRPENHPLHDHATMSTLPKSVGFRLLVPALRPSVARAITPRYRSFASAPGTPEPERKTSSDEAPAVGLKSESTQIRQENAAEGMRHQPDYNVAIDYRTSCVPLARGGLEAI